jgi:hypothetical protein
MPRRCPTARAFLRGFALASTTALPLPCVVFAQSGACDPGLHASTGHPLHYQARGSAQEQTDRCEGIYIQDVSGATLLVVSLTAAFADFDLESEAPLQVEWAAADSDVVHLRAYPLRHKIYYRMDTERAAGTKSYIWPTAVLAALGLSRPDVGVVGWTRRLVGQTMRDVFLPLHISQTGVPPANGYQVVLLPGRELVEVYVTLATVGADGAPADSVRDGVALEYGYYPAGRGIVIPLTGMEEPGLYYLELGATLRGGGVATTELWFLHSE